MKRAFCRRLCAPFALFLLAGLSCNAPQGDTAAPVDPEKESVLDKPSQTQQSGGEDPNGESRLAARATLDERRPNVIWILLDACRARNLSCYGYGRSTSPNIDQLAARGVLFENQFAQGVYTKLSLPSYMTGRHFPVSCTRLGNANAPRQIPAGERLLPQILSENGRLSVCVSAHPYISAGTLLFGAFDKPVFVSPKGAAPYADFEELNKTIVALMPELQDRPFFLYIHAMDTHFPHPLESPHDKWIDPSYTSEFVGKTEPTMKEGCRFSPRDIEQLRGLHDGAIHYADHHVGRLLNELLPSEIMDNTLVLIGADHGDALGEDGTTWGHRETFDQVLHVPFIMAGPGLPKGKRVAALTENADIVPTLVDLLGLKTTAEPDGKSLVPLLRDEPPEPLHDYVFTRMGPYDFPPTYILRTAQYKYEYDSLEDVERLWRAPDDLGNRQSCLEQEPEAAALFKAFVYEDLAPRWKAYDGLGRLYVDLMLTKELVHGAVEAKDVLVYGQGLRPSSEHCEDDKWLFLDDKLWSASWSEKAPPLTLRLEVPPNRYAVHVFLFGAHSIHEHAATSIQIRAENDLEYRVFRWIPPDFKDEGHLFMKLGAYDIADGTFEVALAQGDPRYWAVLRGFRFVLSEDFDEPAVTQREADERNEQLRALGYFD